MAQAATSDDRLILGSGDAQRLGALRWLPPVLIGILVPTTLAVYLFPSALQHLQFWITAFLVAMLIICVCGYTLTVLMPGDVTGVIVDQHARCLQILRESPFATSMKAYAFEDIADVRATQQFDDDGYSLDVVEVTLVNGTLFALPQDTAPADIARLRRAVGLATAAAPSRTRRLR